MLIRTARLDLSGQIAELRENAGGLPHPALEHAAREHADYLTQLGTTTTLLRRQVLLVVREPLRSTPGSDALTRHSPLAAILAKRKTRNRAEPVSEATRQAAESRLARRLAEASEMLAATGLAVTPLDAGAATAVLAACCKPDSLIPPSAELGAPTKSSPPHPPATPGRTRPPTSPRTKGGSTRDRRHAAKGPRHPDRRSARPRGSVHPGLAVDQLAVPGGWRRVRGLLRDHRLSP
ncbi:hypothetical protein ACFSVJ_29145 [Prauserella oleivorans]